MQMLRKAVAARVAASARTQLDQPMKDTNDTSDTSPAPSQTVATAPENPSPMIAATPLGLSETVGSHPRQAWEHVDEILQTLKTTFPLLILSLETMVDQIQHKFKPAQEEDVYRHISLLLSDAVHVRSRFVPVTLNADRVYRRMWSK